jgi:release factor glutamine methyltransferase
VRPNWISSIALHTTIIDLLLQAEKSLRASNVTQTPRLDAEVLLADLLQTDRARLIVSHNDYVGPNVVQLFSRRMERRLQGEPVAYIIGKREFMELDFVVDSRVLIPRPETETLVEYIIDFARDRQVSGILDIGTGSGCIAVSLAVYLPKLSACATDVSPDAIEVARRNAGRHHVLQRISFHAGPYYQPLPGSLKGSFDVIVSNPPYIPDAEYPLLQKNVREYEPEAALRGGPDGLCPFRAIIAEAGQWLTCGGIVVIEIGEHQAAPAAEFMTATGRLALLDIVEDLGGRQRVIVGRKKDE